MTAINPQAVRGPVTAIPVVAGTGVRFVEDVPNNRVVAEVDETVLWSGAKASSCQLSEAINHFEKIGVYLSDLNGKVTEVFIQPTSADFTFPTIAPAMGPNQAGITFRFITVSDNTMTVTKGKTMSINYNDATTTWTADTNTTNNLNTLIKVVGINRVASA